MISILEFCKILWTSPFPIIILKSNTELYVSHFIIKSFIKTKDQKMSKNVQKETNIVSPKFWAFDSEILWKGYQTSTVCPSVTNKGMMA